MRVNSVFNGLLCAGVGLLDVVTSSPVVNSNVNVTKQWGFDEIPSSRKLEIWYPCYGNFACAVLDVQLHYQKPSLGRSLIPLIKIPANPSLPYKGMILMNPGGPGISGIDLILNLNTQDNPISFLRQQHDFVSWSPRGSAYSIPAADCHLTPGLGVPLGPAVTKRGVELDTLHGPYLPQQYFANAYKAGFEVGEECSAAIGGPKDAGPYMSTTTVARDMISILDAFACSPAGRKIPNSDLLNYWGLSYGTMLGQTFASMFPDRVGRVLLDGVLSPDSAVHGKGTNTVELADEGLATFFVYCFVAGPAYCPFATGAKSAHEIFDRFEGIVTQLDVKRALEHNWTNSTAIWIVLEGLKAILSKSPYHAADEYPFVGSLLPALANVVSNLTLEVVEGLISIVPGGVGNGVTRNDTWSTAFACADAGGANLGRKVGEWGEIIEENEKRSWIAGEGIVVNEMFCSGWNITPVERFAGPFGGKTKNPLVFLSNTLDPITPIMNGRIGIKNFKDAQLITVEAVAHTLLPTKNSCGLAKLGAFLINGTYPGKDNYCPPEAGPFGVVLPGKLLERSDVRDIAGRIRELIRRV